MKTSIFALFVILFSAPFALAAVHASSSLSYEVDGLDLWELPRGQNVDQAIRDFTARCSTIPASRILPRIAALGIDPSQFDIATQVSSYRIRGYGTSYRCALDIKALNGTRYVFSAWQLSNPFYDLYDDSTGVLVKSALDQCKEEGARIDARATEINLFDRYILVEWVRNNEPGHDTPNDTPTLPSRHRKPSIQRCFVRWVSLSF
jgi:hypothetical protein